MSFFIFIHKIKQIEIYKIEKVKNMLLHKVINSIDDFLDFLSETNRSNIVDYCDISAPNGNHTFVAKDGSISTVIEVKGMNKIATIADYQRNVVDPLTNQLNNFLKKKGHAIQVYYSSDPTNSDYMIENALAPSRLTAKNLGFDLQDFFDSKKRVLRNSVINESLYLVLWTSVEVLSKTERQDAFNNLKKIQGKIFQTSKESINLFKSFKELEQKHIAFVQGFTNTLKGCGVFFNILDVVAASRAMRKSVDPSFTFDQKEVINQDGKLETVGWRPILPGDKIMPAVRRKMPEKKIFDGMLPNFGWQLIPRTAQEINDKTVLIGDHLYAPVYVDVMPAITYGVTFNSLCNELNRSRMPWRMSMLIEGDGLSSFGLKKMFAQLLWFSNKTNNGLVRRGISNLEMLESNDIAISQVRICFATWTKAEYEFRKDDTEAYLNLDKINYQRINLANIVKTWEGAEVIEATGDPLDGTLSSALSIKRGSIGTKMAAPLFETTRILPFNRTVSPWENGGVLFNTLEGQLIPYYSYNSQQDMWGGLIWAPPGAGKSVLLNYLNLGLCLDSGNLDIPYIRGLDVGRSSEGVANLIKQSLPPNRRHEVLTYRVRNVAERAINPFDTKLGCRTPLPSQMTFLKNLFKVLLSEQDVEGRTTLDSGLAGFIDMLIPMAYEMFSDTKMPKKYQNGFVPEVDEALEKINYKTDSKTTWWQIVDELFKHKMYYEANKAQIYAMPLISDLMLITTENTTLKEYYRIIKDGGNEHLLQAFTRKMQETAEAFPSLNNYTTMDFANSKIAFADLDEVKGADPRTFTILCMNNSFALSKDFFVDKEEADSTPSSKPELLNKSCPFEEYRKYHREEFEKMRSSKKRLFIDELHAAKGNPFIIDQVVDYLRLGRKYKVDILLASQSIDDFSSKMMEFTSAIYIMKPMSQAKMEEIKDIFNFDETECYIVTKGLGGEARSFLARYKMGGDYKNASGLQWASFRVQATLCPEELWAFNTTQINAAVRDGLYERYGVKQTLYILSQLYPHGVEEKAKKIIVQSGGVNVEDEEKTRNAANIIINDIIKEAIDFGLIKQNMFS